MKIEKANGAQEALDEKRCHIFAQGCVLNKFFIVAFLFTILHACDRCRTTSIKSLKPISFYGEIDSIFLNPEAKYQAYVSIKFTNYEIPNRIYKEFSVGDTLFKIAGSMKYYWIKAGDTTIFYPKCGTEKRDEVRDE